MALDHCCVNFCSNDKRKKSGENLSFFNFPPNDLLRSKWIGAIRRGKSRSVSCQIYVLLAIDFSFRLKTQPVVFIYKILIHFISKTLDSINECTILFTLFFAENVPVCSRTRENYDILKPNAIRICLYSDILND